MKKIITLALVMMSFQMSYAADTVSGEYDGLVSSTWNRQNGAPCGLYIDLTRGYFSVGAGNSNGPIGGFAFSTNDSKIANLATPNATVILSGTPDGFGATLELKTDANGRIAAYRANANKTEFVCLGLQPK